MCAQVRVDDECIYWTCYVVWWLWGSKISVLKKGLQKTHCLLGLSLCGSGVTLSNTLTHVHTHHVATFIKHTHHGATFTKHTHTHTHHGVTFRKHVCTYTHHGVTLTKTHTHPHTCIKIHNFFCRECFHPTMLFLILFISTWNNSFKPKMWHKSNGSVTYILGSAFSLQTCLSHEVKSHNVKNLFWLDETFWDELFWEYNCRIKVPPAPRVRIWGGGGGGG